MAETEVSDPAFFALVVAYFAQPPALVSIAVGAAGALVLATGSLVHQWRTWMRVAAALPMAENRSK